MSMKGIERTIADLRKHGDVFVWQDVITYGYQGPYFEQDVRRVTLGDIAGRVEADVADILAENARLRDALKYAIPWACLKCTLWNSRAARCSLGSGMCDQVWKWKRLLGEVSK